MVSPYKKKVFTLFILSLLSFAAGNFIIFPDKIGFCDPQDYICKFDRFPVFSVGEPLAYGSAALSVVFFILIFTSEAVFKAWDKFGFGFIVLSILLIALVPADSGGGWMMPNIDRELITLILGATYIAISFLIIVYKVLEQRVKIRGHL